MKRPRYDHRIRDAVVDSGDIALFPELGIPDSTLRSWLRRGPRPILTALDSVDDDSTLRIQVAKLERQVVILRAVLRLLLTLVRATRINLMNLRVPSASDKSRLIRSVEWAAPIMGVVPLCVYWDSGKLAFENGWRPPASTSTSMVVSARA